MKNEPYEISVSYNSAPSVRIIEPVADINQNRYVRGNCITQSCQENWVGGCPIDY